MQIERPEWLPDGYSLNFMWQPAKCRGGQHTNGGPVPGDAHIWIKRDDADHVICAAQVRSRYAHKARALVTQIVQLMWEEQLH